MSNSGLAIRASDCERDSGREREFLSIVFMGIRAGALSPPPFLLSVSVQPRSPFQPTRTLPLPSPLGALLFSGLLLLPYKGNEPLGSPTVSVQVICCSWLSTSEPLQKLSFVPGRPAYFDRSTEFNSPACSGPLTGPALCIDKVFPPQSLRFRLSWVAIARLSSTRPSISRI